MKLNIANVKDLRTKKPAELTAYVNELKNQYNQLTHQISLNNESKTHQIGVIKRAIARAKTIQNEMLAKEDK